MAWLAWMGGYVMSAIGIVGYSYGTAMVVGGAIVGAAVGAVYTAFNGGNLLKNVLYGAVGGAVIGGAGALLAGGTGAFGASGVASTGQGATAAEAAAANASLYSTEAGFASGGGAAGGGWLEGGGSSLIGGVASLGGAFMKGDVAGEDRDAQLALKEKELEQQRQLTEKEIAATMHNADTAAAASRGNALTAAQTAAQQLAENRRQFDKDFDEQKRQYDTTRGDTLTAKERFNESVAAGGQYAAGQAQSVSLVEVNRRRTELPQPFWSTGKTVDQNTQVQLAGAEEPKKEEQGILAGATA